MSNVTPIRPLPAAPPVRCPDLNLTPQEAAGFRAVLDEQLARRGLPPLDEPDAATSWSRWLTASQAADVLAVRAEAREASPSWTR